MECKSRKFLRNWLSVLLLPTNATMPNRDSQRSWIQLHESRLCDLTEAWTDKIDHPDISIPPERQPINPEDEDDVIPDQHAAFGIQQATRGTKEPSWRDLGLDDLLEKKKEEPIQSKKVKPLR
jgi:hypothetical protein